MTILLTGASGNIGSHTLRALVRDGKTVRCLAHRAAPPRLPGVLTVRGDIRDADAVAAACDGVDTVVHLAAVIPPGTQERPVEAREVNVTGTAHVVAACRRHGARLLYVSSFDVHGHTLRQPPPRHVDDPVVATDDYTAHKIEAERLVRESGIDWCVLRFADVPVLGIRPAHPIMFEIGLDNRIEAMHADDAALALANALRTPEVWGRVLFVGGGPSCQVTYREYLTRLLAAMGVDPLPDSAFSDQEYVTDWLDTRESQRLLRYQRHDFDDIATAIAASLGWRRHLVPLVKPLVRAHMLRLSPYYRRGRVMS